MDSVNALTNLPLLPLADRKSRVPVAAEPASAGADTRAREQTNPGINGNRYRVDEAYRSYQDTRAKGQSPRPTAANSDTPKISSADLLESMIHRMGGAAMPSAKGVFVDIAV